MQKLLIFFIGISVVNATIPNKLDYFLDDINNIENLESDKYNEVKIELDKVLETFLDEAGYLSFYEKSSRIEKIKSKYFDLPRYTYEIDSLLSELTEKEQNSLPESFYNEIEQSHTSIIDKDTTIVENKIIYHNAILYNFRPDWDDVVDFYGGYAQIVSKGITKDDLNSGRYDIQSELSYFEFIDSVNCIAHTEITGNLEFIGIKDNKYSHPGKFMVDKILVDDIINRNTPNVKFEFEGGKYIDKQAYDVPISYLLEGYDSVVEKYNKGIILLVDGMIDEDEFYAIPQIYDLLNEEKEIEIKKLDQKKYNYVCLFILNPIKNHNYSNSYRMRHEVNINTELVINGKNLRYSLEYFDFDYKLEEGGGDAIFDIDDSFSHNGVKYGVSYNLINNQYIDLYSGVGMMHARIQAGKFLYLNQDVFSTDVNSPFIGIGLNMNYLINKTLLFFDVNIQRSFFEEERSWTDINMKIGIGLRERNKKKYENL